MNTIAWLEFELINYDVAKQYVNHFATEISLPHLKVEDVKFAPILLYWCTIVTINAMCQIDI